jgi:hypothetical protein
MINVSDRGSRDTVVLMVWSLLVLSSMVVAWGHEHRGAGRTGCGPPRMSYELMQILIRAPDSQMSSSECSLSEEQMQGRQPSNREFAIRRRVRRSTGSVQVELSSLQALFNILSNPTFPLLVSFCFPSPFALLFIYQSYRRTSPPLPHAACLIKRAK